MKKSRFTRLAAIVLAAATLWITAVTAGADSLRSAIAAVRDSARLPVALLRWELGDTFPVDALALPAMLALRESPLLLSAWAEVSSLPASDDATPVPEPDTPRKEPEETPQPSLPANPGNILPQKLKTLVFRLPCLIFALTSVEHCICVELCDI